MTDAPTTRETADHAELLVRLANDMRKFEHHTVGSLRIDMDEVRKIIAACDGNSALLSEIAALRGEFKMATVNMCEQFNRAAQAERQRDELRKALERIADEAPYRSGYCQSDVEYGPTLSADEMQAVARQALTNQGADQ